MLISCYSRSAINNTSMKPRSYLCKWNQADIIVLSYSNPSFIENIIKSFWDKCSVWITLLTLPHSASSTCQNSLSSKTTTRNKPAEKSATHCNLWRISLSPTYDIRLPLSSWEKRTRLIQFLTSLNVKTYVMCCFLPFPVVLVHSWRRKWNTEKANSARENGKQ